MGSKDEFYVTLPSNGSISMQEYPANKNNSWKTRLPKPIKLDGEWEVGLSSVSYPSESRLRDYLNSLKDANVMLKTSRILWDENLNVWGITNLMSHMET